MSDFTRLLLSRNTFSLLSHGNSMLPLIRSGDIVTYRKVPFSKIRTNDILLVERDGKLLTHRVAYVGTKHLILKGDNNRQSDGKILPRHVIAKAVSVKRNGIRFSIDQIYLQQSVYYLHEINRILALLEKKHIPVVVLKGLPLHLYYEGSHPRRLYSDCDILIPGTHAGAARDILKRAGYRKADTRLSAGHGILKDKQTEETYYKKLGKFPVVFDVHYEAVFMMTQLGKLNELYPQRLIEQMTREYLSERRFVRVGGAKYPILSEKHLVTYLMLHFFHHNFRGLFRLELIRAILRKSRQPLWFEVAAYVSRYRVYSFVYPGCLLLNKYFPGTIPGTFLSQIASSPDTRRYLQRRAMSVNIFDAEPRVWEGINRFVNLFMLSPLPLLTRLRVFLNPAVLYSVLWIGFHAAASFLSTKRKQHLLQ